eukprot:XP_024305799.1 golgin A8 family member S isoform X2 [Homo sapiens]
MREQALLKAQLTQLKESLKEVQLERDEYAEHLKGERARWQQRMRKMSQEVCSLKKEKKHDKYRVETLERSLSKLKNQMAEPLPPEPPAVPSEAELQHLRKELERVAGALQAQVEYNQRISLLNEGQKERLREQQERLPEQEERLQQLAEPQNSFKELNNENKSVLQLEQQVKELQEKLGKERLEAASQQKQQLTAQLSLMALPGEGDGGGHLDSEGEEAPRPIPSIPQDLESREAMVAFFKSAGASAQEKQAQLQEQVKEQRVAASAWLTWWPRPRRSQRQPEALEPQGLGASL